MMKFYIDVKIEISKIKSVFKSNVKSISPGDMFGEASFTKKYHRRFVGSIDGLEFKVMVIHFLSYLRSPILNGIIEESGKSSNNIELKFRFHPLYIIISISILAFYILLMILSLKDNDITVTSIVFCIGLFIIVFEIYLVFSKMRELRFFIQRIYEPYILRKKNCT